MTKNIELTSNKKNEREYRICLDSVFKNMLKSVFDTILFSSKTFLGYQKTDLIFFLNCDKEFESLLFQMLSENKTVGLVLSNYLNIVFKQNSCDYAQDELEEYAQYLAQINESLFKNRENITLMLKYLSMIEDTYKEESAKSIEEVINESHILSLRIAMINTYASASYLIRIEKEIRLYKDKLSSIVMGLKSII